MKLKIFSIYDSQAAAFLPPFFLTNEAVARRHFYDSANDPNHMFCMHPNDYTLFMLGTWDDDNGFFDLLQVSINMGLATIFKQGYKTPAAVVKDSTDETEKRDGPPVRGGA